MNIDPFNFLELSRDILSREEARLRFRAPGESMRPFILNRDILTVEPVNGTPLRRGDILLFQAGRKPVAHRLVRFIEKDGQRFLVTQGDNNPLPDVPLYPRQVLGRVVKVERDNRTIRLDTGFYGLVGRFWAAMPRQRRCLRHIFRPAWAVYRRLSGR